MSLDELEQYEFNGYQMPQKYKNRVLEYRNAYEIQDHQQVQDDYKLGLIQGQIERATTKNKPNELQQSNPQFSEHEKIGMRKVIGNLTKS